jgi:acyl dehydratase
MTIASLRDRLGQEVGVSAWREVSQGRIDRFAEATDDPQWIHVDPTRAAADSPFGTTIAHGFLTLSLLVPFAADAVRLDGVRIGINYGLNRVRFVAPVPSGARIRARFTVQAVEEIAGGAHVTWTVIIEREHGEKPCCVAEWIVRYEFDRG